jgi:hypothetical protein
MSGDSAKVEHSDWLAKGDLTKPLLNEVSSSLSNVVAKGGLSNGKKESSPGVAEKSGRGEGKQRSHKAACSYLLATVVCLILLLELAGGWFGAIRSTVQVRGGACLNAMSDMTRPDWAACDGHSILSLWACSTRQDRWILN